MKKIFQAIIGAGILGLIGSIFGLTWALIGVIVGLLAGYGAGKEKEKYIQQQGNHTDITETNSPKTESHSDYDVIYNNASDNEINIEENIPSKNPFSVPLSNLFLSIRKVKFNFPYLPQIIELFVLSLSILVMAILYISIGITYQIEQTLNKLMVQSSSKIRECSMIEKSAYAVISIIYIVFWLPFWIILMPFNCFGSA